MSDVIKALNGIPIIVSDRIPRHRIVFGTDIAAGPHGLVVIMHPLDKIAIDYQDRNPYDHLDAAMGWILNNANNQLDALAKRLEATR